MNAADTLRSVGLTRYQAMLLVCLVERDGPATSATLAAESGVPRTSVYTVADSLGDMGLCSQAALTGPAQWWAAEWPTTCRQLRKHLEANLAEQVQAVAELAYTCGGFR